MMASGRPAPNRAAAISPPPGLIEAALQSIGRSFQPISMVLFGVRPDVYIGPSSRGAMNRTDGVSLSPPSSRDHPRPWKNDQLARSGTAGDVSRRPLSLCPSGTAAPIRKTHPSLHDYPAESSSLLNCPARPISQRQVGNLSQKECGK